MDLNDQINALTGNNTNRKTTPSSHNTKMKLHHLVEDEDINAALTGDEPVSDNDQFGEICKTCHEPITTWANVEGAADLTKLPYTCYNCYDQVCGHCVIHTDYYYYCSPECQQTHENSPSYLTKPQYGSP